jgi:hypothetical protein
LDPEVLEQPGYGRLIGWGFEVFDDLGFDALFAQQLQRLTGFASTGVVVDGDAHDGPPSMTAKNSKGFPSNPKNS